MVLEYFLWRKQKTRILSYNPRESALPKYPFNPRSTKLFQEPNLFNKIKQEEINEEINRAFERINITNIDTENKHNLLSLLLNKISNILSTPIGRWFGN